MKPEWNSHFKVKFKVKSIRRLSRKKIGKKKKTCCVKKGSEYLEKSAFQIHLNINLSQSVIIRLHN